MAKLKAPLLSLGASGSLAKTLTFFNWKGINVVREWVKPANPDTALQRTQREYLRLAVALVHQAQQRAAQPMNELDQTAYSLLARVQNIIMTWFNSCTKMYLDVARAAKDPCVYRNGFIGAAGAADFRPVIYFQEETLNAIQDGHFFAGLSYTNLLYTVAADITVGSNADIAPGNGFDQFDAGDKVYWQFRPDAGDDAAGANSGIYSGYAT